MIYQYLCPCSASFALLFHQSYKSLLQIHVPFFFFWTILFSNQSGYFLLACSKDKLLLYWICVTRYSSGTALFKNSKSIFEPTLNALTRSPFFVIVPTIRKPWNKLSYCTLWCNSEAPCVQICQVNRRFNFSNSLTTFENKGIGFLKT